MSHTVFAMLACCRQDATAYTSRSLCAIMSEEIRWDLRSQHRSQNMACR